MQPLFVLLFFVLLSFVLFLFVWSHAQHGRVGPAQAETQERDRKSKDEAWDEIAQKYQTDAGGVEVTDRNTGKVTKAFFGGDEVSSIAGRQIACNAS